MNEQILELYGVILNELSHQFDEMLQLQYDEHAQLNDCF
jgi:hypothetical protein